MDLGAGHLAIIVGTGAGHLPTKITRRAGHSTNFFKRPGFAREFAQERVLAVGIYSHINET